MKNQEAFENGLKFYLDKGHAIETMRDDIKLRQLAIDLGYEIEYGVNFSSPLVFKKGDKRVWYCRKGWACAELTLTRYCNHRYYDELEVALNTEK